MTIRELIEELEDLAEEHGDDVEVRIAQQPRWPLEYAIDSVVAAAADGVGEDDDDDDDETATVVYLAEGNQIGYLGAAGTRALGWK